MKHYMLLSLLLALGCVHGAPVEQDDMEEVSCEDAFAKSAADEALTKINQDRTDGYVFSLHRLSSAHTAKHEEGFVFYLSLDVVETNCSVISKKDWKTCEARAIADTPVYGRCKAAIFISRPNRVVRLYKYDCTVRPAPATKIHEICPDCPSHTALDGDQVQKAASLSLEKFNKESGLSHYFSLVKISRATSGMSIAMYYNVEYTIQETTCTKGAEAVATDKCPVMDCEFAHKGFCKGSHFKTPTGDDEVSVDCEIFEPEAAEREKKLHLLGGETDHSHTSSANHDQSHDQAHASTLTTASTTTRTTTDAGSSHRHAHDHSHDHGHGHDHVHAHHAKAHNHSADFPNQHHDYKHADGVHTHDHDHELALDHDHKHGHLHEHEHHHHHHTHDHENGTHDHPEGTVKTLPSMDQPMTLPVFPDVPEVGVVLPAKPDPQIPGQMEPVIRPFPTSVSAQCPPPALSATFVEKLFSEDPLFKPAA
ncbi:Fetuin-B [Nibea albiflora]|uniref:Fetuin-B n=1 Tax=Nibea albiflora TaxID=240163 RepID=A0ACB7EMA4_NIBAL|nr:Fetuin-B [Nibea albiflora]